MKSTAVTLCFLLRDGAAGMQVLLGTKKTGFGVGKIVGLGGHVEPGESDAEAACREVFEEAGIVVTEDDLSVAGLIEFVFPARPEWNMSTSLFTARRWTGDPVESHGNHPGVVPGRCPAAGAHVAGCRTLAAAGAGGGRCGRRHHPER